VRSERVLTRRELNRALLARQLLLRRQRLGVPRATERIGAIQAQWPQAPYLALWSRLDGFAWSRLARAVERREVVKTTLMRSTLHHVSARDYLAYAGLFVSQRVTLSERQLAGYIETDELERLTREVRRHTVERPRSRPELLELLGRSRLVSADRRPWLVWHYLVASAGLVHGPTSSVWRKHTAGGTFVPASEWLGAEGATGAAAAEHLVRRYLAAFGPATRADIARWTGLPAGVLREGLGRVALRRFRDEEGRLLLDLPRAPLPPPDTEAPVRLLPMWDSSLLAYADRTRILPADYRADVIPRGGDIQPTILVDGFVAGRWRLDGDRVQLEPFERLGKQDRHALAAEETSLTRFLAATD
jgi:hypothetical protein